MFRPVTKVLKTILIIYTMIPKPRSKNKLTKKDDTSKMKMLSETKKSLP